MLDLLKFMNLDPRIFPLIRTPNCQKYTWYMKYVSLKDFNSLYSTVANRLCSYLCLSARVRPSWIGGISFHAKLSRQVSLQPWPIFKCDRVWMWTQHKPALKRAASYYVGQPNVKNPIIGFLHGVDHWADLVSYFQHLILIEVN